MGWHGVLKGMLFKAIFLCLSKDKYSQCVHNVVSYLAYWCPQEINKARHPCKSKFIMYNAIHKSSTVPLHIFILFVCFYNKHTFCLQLQCFLSFSQFHLQMWLTCFLVFNFCCCIKAIRLDIDIEKYCT